MTLMKSENTKIGAVILAAGKSTRMKSKVSKLLTPFDGEPLIQRVLRNCQPLNFAQMIMVIGPEALGIQELFGATVQFAIQSERLGTGHALMQARRFVEGVLDEVVVLVGDHPFVDTACLQFLITEHHRQQAAATLLTTIFDQPPAYGRILRSASGQITRIVEEKDATAEQRKIKEVNISTYCFQVAKVFPLLTQLQAHNAQKEYYLTDIVALLLQNGEKVHAAPYPDNRIGIGINDRVELAHALQIARRRHLEKLMRAGVTIVDPATTYIDATVQIEPDTIVYPFSYLEQNTTIGRDGRIGPHVRIVNSQIQSQVTLEFAVIENS
ncbi:NTP transferase domain-containing protein, partial [candidate division KSB1 bacterium]|nr:NTP transferase domain-containing protein [candidate division KSB1 bacterium]